MEFMVDAQEAQQAKAVSVVGYIWILFLIPLLVARDNRFARFHANQALVLFIISIINGIIAFIPLIGWLASGVLSVVLFICMVLGMMNAARGQAKSLPFIGGITIIQSY